MSLLPFFVLLREMKGDTMPFCHTCEEHFFEDSRHACPSQWEVVEDPEEDDPAWCHALTVYAVDGQSAAEEYCERADQGGDYAIARNGAATVAVRQLGTTEVEYYRVHVQTINEYSACRI